jgi:hypothetical protein
MRAAMTDAEAAVINGDGRVIRSLTVDSFVRYAPELLALYPARKHTF